MAGSVFGFGPRGILPQTTSQDPAARRATIDNLASQSQVPANVLMALEEGGETAETASQRLSAEIAAGKRVEDVVDPKVMSRAYDLADQLYPEAPKPEPTKGNAIADAAKQFGGAVVSGIGSMGEAVGGMADIYADGGVKLDPQPSMIGDAARSVGGGIRAFGDSMKGTVSEQGQAAMEGSMPDGDLFAPSTWTLGKNPSLRGYAMLAADVMGSFLPVVATAVVTRNPAASALVGGAQGGGAAVETARDTILEMSKTQHPNGGTVLQHESAYYRSLIERGVPPTEAVRRTSEAAEKMAMLFTLPVSTFGGAATGKILGPGVDALAGKGLAARAIGTGALSSLEEGAQESAESIATRTGVNVGAETNLSPTEGTFGDFILGALGGGVPGAAAGAIQRKDEEDETTGGDGSAPGSAAVPGDGPIPGAGAGAAAPNQPTGPLAPSGPISTISGLAPDLTPQPEPEPPAPRFPDFKPGKDVRLADPETGAIHDAVFISETPGGVVVRIAGGEFEIDRESFDASRIAAAQADETAAGKKPKATKAETPQPIEPREPILSEEGAFDAAAAALKEQGFYDGAWNAGGTAGTPTAGTVEAPKVSDTGKPAATAKRPKENLADLTPDEALKRAKALEDKAAKGDWTGPMRKKHQQLMAIAGGQNGTQAQGQPGSEKGGAGTPGYGGAGTVGSGRDAGVAGGGDRPASGEPPQRLPVDKIRADGPSDNDGALTIDPDSELGIRMNDAYRDMLFDHFKRGKTKDINGIEAPALRLAKRIKDSGGDLALEDMIEVADEADRIMALPPDRRIDAAIQVARRFGGTAMTAKPIEKAPADRVQPDLLGGEATNEAAMAAKEARRKEWGRFLGIAEGGKSSDDSTLEGREVLVRGKTIRIRAENGKASDQDYRLDTDGMDRDQIAAAVRGALNELDRRSPLPVTPPAKADAGTPAAATSRAAEAAGDGPAAKKAGAPKAEDHRDLNFEDTGGQFVNKRVYPGFVVSPAGNGFKVTREGETTPVVTAATLDQVADLMRSFKNPYTGEAFTAPAAPETAPKAEAPAPKADGLLSVLSPEKQARMAELQAKLAAKVRNQMSSGLDPEYITLGGEMVALYIEAGVKRFGQMLANFAESTGLTLKQAQEPMRAAYNHVRDNMELEGEDTSGMDDARTVLEEARKAIQGAEKPAKPKAEPEPPVSRAADRPTGKTYRLENALTPAERRIIGAARGEYVGDVFAELDNAARRADADLRSRDLDIDAFDDTGNRDGKPDQMAWFIREAEAHARALVKQVKDEGPENVGPLDKDEDTGDWEYNGSELSNALEFLDQQYSMGLGVDEDVIPGPGVDDDTDLSTMDPALIFPAPPKGPRNLDAIADREGFIPMDEATARLQFWKNTAAKIGGTTKNRNKVILSLFDYKGTWSQPWVDAGYTVIRHDIKTGSDLITDQWIYERITEIRQDGKEVYGVLSACPCTTFTGSGARWWAERHDVESPEALAQVFGDRAVSSGAKSALEYNIMLADATRAAIRLAKPTGFHVLENPIGRIQDKAKFPDPLARFHPHNFGDPYTKRTQLFGDFKPDLPLANVDPVEGSKMQNKLRGSDPLGKEDRSTTPEGFAYAFFMANDPDARKVKDDAVKGGAGISPPPAPTASIEVSPAPAPYTAPWWDTADDMTRNRIMEEAGVAKRTIGQGFSSLPEPMRKALTDAFGRLYRDGKIENIGTIEAPRFALTGETIDAVPVASAVTERTPQGKSSLPKGGAVGEDAAQDVGKAKGDVLAAVKLARERGDEEAIGKFGIDMRSTISQRLADEAAGYLMAYAGVQVEDIRERAAVLRGLPKDRPPQVPNISLKWDDKEGGFVFSRKHADIVLQAAYVEEDKIKAEAAAKPAPTAAEVKAAAAETAPDPTPAQAEAENYKTGKTDWRGLTLSIENAKGSTRRKVTPDGKTAWEVVMPAHYGRILGTTGADGDHVDFYMGPDPKHEMVYVIDQRDADTGEFDEHKVMLGFKSQNEARDAYFAGFSDGNGPIRLMSITPMGYADAVMNLKHNPAIWKGPISQTDAALPAKPAKAPVAKSTSPAANRAFPDFKGKLNGPYYDDRSEDGRFNAEKNAFHEAGLSFFRATAKILKDNGWTEAMPRGNGRGKAKPINPVSSNKAGPASLGEVSITMMGPDGAYGIYAQLGESFSGGNRAQMMWRVTQAKDPFGGLGPNQFLDPTGMTPQEFAEKVIAMQERFAKKADTTSAPKADMAPAAPAIDGTAFEAVGMVKGKATSEDAWFRKQREQGGIASYKARSVASGWKLTRDFTPDSTTAPPTRQLGTFSTPAEAIAQLRENGMRTGVPEEAPASVSVAQPETDQGTSASEADRIARRSQRAPWTLAGATKTTLTEDEAFEYGKKHFRDGYARLVPTEITLKHGHAASAWYRGWDRANLDEPMPSDEPAPIEPRLIEGTVEVADDLNGDAAEVEVSQDGPWDFNETFPSPDPVQVGRLEREGRSPFDANSAEEVVGILSETMNEAVDHRATQQRWAREVQNLEDGGRPTFTVPKGKDALQEAEKNLDRATQSFNDTVGAVADVWGDKGADAFRKEASDRADQSLRQSPQDAAPPIPTPAQGLVSPDSQDGGKPAIMGPSATGKTRNEQRRNKRRDQGQPDLFAAQDGAVDGEGRPAAERDRDGRGEGDEDAAGGEPRPEQAGSLVGDQGRVPDRVGVAPPNFVIPADFALGSGTDGQKLEANLAALRLVKTLEAENRYATPDEQLVLARWVGWGGLKTLFDEKHAGKTNQWGRAQAELKSLLTKTEYYDAMRSTNDAHYTSRTVVSAMWGAFRNFGFKGGRALEPTIGSGNFLGLQPGDLSASTDWFAAELDPVTGRIAKHLYPRATVFDGMGFQDAPFRPATFDIAIGNPPFGGDNSRVGNKKMHPDLGRMKVHNFVIAKTGQLLREGGIMGMVVTHRFLDAMDAEARDVLAPNYHFLGAVRLPNTAFKANAGTEVTTDIVFFQKRRAGDEQGDTSWMQSGVTGPNGAKMNAWFANNPDMILGRAAMDGTMYAGGRKGEGEFTVHDDGRDLGKALTEALAKIKASLPDRETQLEDAVTAPKTVSSLAYGDMMLSADGRIFRGDQDESGNAVVEEITRETFWKANAAAQFDLVQALRPFAEADLRDASVDQTQRVRDAAVGAGLLDLAGDPVAQSTKFEQALADAIPALMFGRPTQAHRDAFADYAKKVEAKRLGSDGFDRLKGILDLRGRTMALIRAERNDDPAMEQIRGGLRTAYAQFKAKYGFLNNSKNEAILQGNVGPEMALEIKYKPASKDGRAEAAEIAPIQNKRVIFPHKLPDHVDSVTDAMHVSMQEKGYIDPGLVSQLTDKTVAEVIAELTSGDKPLAFKNPANGRYELAESYLSGNLAEKIEKATAARAYEHIPHLKAAMPPPKTQEQITPTIRSMWIPRQVFEDFLRAMGYSNPSVSIMEKVGMVSVQTSGRSQSDFGDQFKTEKMSPKEIFTHALKGKIPVVYDTIRTADGDKRVKNEEATKEAVAAYERMSAEFPEWAYANPLRAGQIVDAFNTKVNVVTKRQYEGVRYLRTVGASPLVELRNSQKNGAWRMIQDAVVLLHHVVGAGKTMTGITGVMERKRMGLTRKALVVVPNHLTGQWGKEWLELYPAANILVPTEKDFEPANRAKLINRIATGDFDAVIIGHSQLVKIDNDPEIVAKYIGDEMDALNEAMQAAKQSGESKRTVGQMAARIQKLRDKLENLNDKLSERRGAGLLSWPELGVDTMVLDESQEFKNLEYATSATQLVGMNDPNGSEKAFDLLMKLRSLQAMQGSNITFMTGTPISNSLVEIYSVMKYLIPDSLDAMSIKHFDAWKAAFIQDESRFEYTASMQLKERNVMSGMVNLGPLAELYRSFADIVMRPDVERMYREQMEAKNAASPGKAPVSTRFPTPKIKGDKRRIMLAPPTGNMEEFTRYLVMRMTGIKNAPDKKAYAKTDNPLWVLTDARKASVDIRTIDPTQGREEGSKVVRAGAEVFRIWEANKDRRGAQMVFCDMSTPSKGSEKAARAILKDAYGRLGLKKDALKRRIAEDESKSFSARWSDVVGEVEALISSPETDDAKRDALSAWAASPAVQEAAGDMFTADTGFSFYDDLKALLVEKGIPAEEIAFIHDYDTTAKKKELFDTVNEGKVRVLIGSTMKMGAGTNAQRRLVALHHIDAPWRPSDMEQREGRIIRQGNLFYEQDPDGFEVEILAYSTEKTSDVVQWQVLERKAKAIETFLNAAADSLIEEGGDADQYAEFMAQSTGKKVFLEKMQAEKDLIGARGRIASALRSRSEAQRFLEDYDEVAAKYRQSYEELDKVQVDAFPDGAAEYLAGWHGQVEAYKAARDKAEAEADEVRKYNVGRDRKDWKRLPAQPNAPKRWTERPSNAYEAAVYDALSRAAADVGSEVTKKIQLGNGFKIEVFAKSQGDGPLVFYVDLAGPKGQRLARLTDWQGVTTKDFRNSDKLLAAFDPAGVAMTAKAIADQDRRYLQRHVGLKPRMDEIAARAVDDSEVKRLQERVASLSAETRIEEVKYAEESAKAGVNRFAMLDKEGRDLSVDGSTKPLTGQFQFQNAGRSYASEWGAPAGRKRIEGTDKWGDSAYFEATDMDSGAPVIIEAVQPPKPSAESVEMPWQVARVYERTTDGVKEMRATEFRASEDKPVDDYALRMLTKELNAEAEKHGLAGKITVRAVRQIVLASGARLHSSGVYERGTASIQIKMGGTIGAKHVMRHEIIHALRDAKTWGKSHGLFTEREWRLLERAALADAEIRDSVLDRYPDLDAEAQMEEMVAELYRLWAEGRDSAGALEKVLEKIMGFFEALANLLRGRGYLSAAGIMEEIANGTIGGAAPTPPGGGRKGADARELRAWHGSAADFDNFSTEFMGSGEGAQAFGWGLYFADSKGVAEHYRKQMAEKKIVLRGGATGSRAEREALDLISFNFNNAMDEADPAAIDRETMDAWADQMDDEGEASISAELRRIDPADLQLAKGRLYQVEIPEADSLLDWDKPLSQQPAKVRNALKKLHDLPYKARGGGLMPFGDFLLNDPTGEMIVNALRIAATTDRANDLGKFAPSGPRERAAALVLRDAGIPGHRFLDGRSRSPGDGRYNYVIYDEAAVSIAGKEMREGGLLPSGARRKFKNLLGSAHWKNPGAFASNALTDAMAGKGPISTLALVPGRALFAELGKRIMSAKTYLRAKEEMDALRNGWHAKADEIAQVWRKARNRDPRGNDDLMDLMHRSTLTGVDPSKADTWKHAFAASAEREYSRMGDKAPKWAMDVLDQIDKHKRSYATLKEKYDALPEDMKAIYRNVRAQYDKLGDEFEKAVLENIEAGLKVAIKRAEKAFRKEMQRIRDEGLQGDEKAEAIEKAQAALDAVKKRGGWGAKAKIAALRKQFESNKLKGPYFPLARFGQFFVTVRNAQGEVTSFSRFEKEAQQQAFIRDQKEAGETNIQFGVLSDSAKLRQQVDPAFVADVEGVLADAGASEAVMDAIWQRWLETLPDTSIRTAKIHRKGREGWNQDAFRAFGHHMFHGAHQLARLKYGLELEEALNDAEDEARLAEDPNRAGLIVNEMRKRHEFAMNPQGSSAVAGLSSLSFVWYLGATPAAALANVSQTTVIGPGVMAARFKSAGVSGAVRELGRAMKDFTKGRGDVQKAPGITQDEHAAITEAYRRGTIDKTQAHDLASVAETGIEYNAARENVMRKIGWFFHQAERMNREVTFLANYRLARAEGMSREDATDAAADLTWTIHFDYQNTSRPRFMQNDMGKVLTIFRNYSVNLAWRMFRDVHQSLAGATKEERAEARKQLVGVTLSMMLHAGIKGTYGYGIIMLLLSMFFPGDSDDIEEWMQDALLMEGDSLGVAAWNYAMGAALNGAPGQILGADMSERIGSPNIWFRGADKDLEGEDLVMHYVTELLGPPLGIALGIGRGMQKVTDGEVYRGVETAVPKVVRDLMKAGRYGVEGVKTAGGDDILPDVNPYQLLLQASGFTPAEVAERYDMNSRLKNKEREIMDERKGIHAAAVDALLAGEELPESVMDDIRDFNRRFPEYPITAKTIRASAKGRQRAHQDAENGVSLNKRLSSRLREGLAPAIYN